MILQNGFGQALAFWLAKGKAEYLTLYDILTKWLKITDTTHFGACQQRRDFVQKLAEMDQLEYLRSQNEALSLLEWVKRFANADLA
jgi:CRISPR-associated protein Cmr5